MAALKISPLYYGVDLVIPVLVQRKPSYINVLTDDIFTFIPVQFKSFFEQEENVISKISLNSHYIGCRL